jgi:hypothetical protein
MGPSRPRRLPLSRVTSPTRDDGGAPASRFTSAEVRGSRKRRPHGCGCDRHVGRRVEGRSRPPLSRGPTTKRRPMVHGWNDAVGDPAPRHNFGLDPARPPANQTLAHASRSTFGLLASVLLGGPTRYFGGDVIAKRSKSLPDNTRVPQRQTMPVPPHATHGNVSTVRQRVQRRGTKPNRSAASSISDSSHGATRGRSISARDIEMARRVHQRRCCVAPTRDSSGAFQGGEQAGQWPLLPSSAVQQFHVGSKASTPSISSPHSRQTHFIALQYTADACEPERKNSRSIH